MITDKEIIDCANFHGKSFAISSSPEIADIHHRKERLKEFTEGTETYKSLKKYIDINQDLFLKGNLEKQTLTKEEWEKVKGIGRASNELIEEYRKRVDEVIKEMKE